MKRDLAHLSKLFVGIVSGLRTVHNKKCVLYYHETKSQNYEFLNHTIVQQSEHMKGHDHRSIYKVARILTRRICKVSLYLNFLMNVSHAGMGTLYVALNIIISS